MRVQVQALQLHCDRRPQRRHVQQGQRCLAQLQHQLGRSQQRQRYQAGHRLSQHLHLQRLQQRQQVQCLWAAVHSRNCPLTRQMMQPQRTVLRVSLHSLQARGMAQTTMPARGGGCLQHQQQTPLPRRERGLLLATLNPHRRVRALQRRPELRAGRRAREAE